MSTRRRFLFVALVVLILPPAVLFGSTYVPVGGKITGRGPSNDNAIALTFDDGPNAEWTPQIIDILNRYHAKGTFFLIGINVERHPEIARLIVDNGDQVGNHSWSHSNYLPYYTPEQITEDYNRAQNAIHSATGVWTKFYRAPHGRLTPWMRFFLREQGTTLAGWDYSPRDWTNLGADVIVKRVVSRARPGAVFLLHDGIDLNRDPDRSQLVQALPQIIEQLQAEGYQIVTLADLMGQEAYR